MLHVPMPFLLFTTLGCLLQTGFVEGAPYYGVLIGKLNTMFHDVTGHVYAVDENTLFLKGFTYDGTGPDAYFWAGNTVRPDPTGIIIPDEKGSTKPLGAYNNQDVVLRLPEGKTLRDIKWFAVWCRRFKANFGDIIFPKNLEIPEPAELPPLTSLEHGVSSGPITILDAQTFLVPNFKYDGEGPAAYWWVSRGSRQNPGGTRLKDENGSSAPLKRYTGRTVVISLPERNTIYDYDWLGVWCEEFNADFGHVRLPQNVKVPPSPRMLGVKVENKLNCEVLHDQQGYEIRWVMDADDVLMQLVARLDDGDYMSFGLSKDDTKSNMVDADAIVAWIDKKGRGHAVDYFLGSKEQCIGNKGSCPDVKHRDGTDSLTMLNAATVNGYTMITVRRPQLGVDEEYDQHIYSDGPQAVLWAIGPLNNRGEVSYHRVHNRGDMFIDFAREPAWNCPSPDNNANKKTSASSPVGAKKEAAEPLQKSAAGSRTSATNENAAWEIPPIVCPTDRTFTAQIGPTGGKKGYQAITGKVGWGIAWYINGQLIPELVVQRGVTYTFIVEGGNDPQHSSRRHPLYITDDAEGGYDYKSEAERKKEKVYAGVFRDSNGESHPTAVGRLCEWQIDTSRREPPESFATFSDFQKTLKMKCWPGQQAIMRWRPDHNTPDLVYYQCYTHRLLGWKIHVVDSCDDVYQDGSELAGASSILRPRNITLPTVQLVQEPGSERNPHSIKSDEGDTRNTKKKANAIQEVTTPSTPISDFDTQTQPSRTQFQGPSNTEEEFVLNSTEIPQNQHIFTRIRNTNNTKSDAQSVPQPTYHNFDPSLDLEKSLFQFGAKLPFGGGIPPKSSYNRVKFESGFIPIQRLSNNSEQRFPDPTLPPFDQKRPLPFSTNNSVPFHGSFKPGKPDFSGFSVSTFGQGSRPSGPVSVPLHVPLGVPLQTKRPQVFQRPVVPPSLRPSPIYRPHPSGDSGAIIPNEKPVFLNPGVPLSVSSSQIRNQYNGDPLLAIERISSEPSPGKIQQSHPKRVTVFFERPHFNRGPVNKGQPNRVEPNGPFANQHPQLNKRPLRQPNGHRAQSQAPLQKSPSHSTTEATETVTEIREIPIFTTISTGKPTFLIPLSITEGENGTDYSILSHVLSLIARDTQPPMAITKRPRTKREADKPSQNSRTKENLTDEDDHQNHDHSHENGNKEKRKDSGNSATKISPVFLSIPFALLAALKRNRGV